MQRLTERYGHIGALEEVASQQLSKVENQTIAKIIELTTTINRDPSKWGTERMSNKIKSINSFIKKHENETNPSTLLYLQALNSLNNLMCFCLIKSRYVKSEEPLRTLSMPDLPELQDLNQTQRCFRQLIQIQNQVFIADKVSSTDLISTSHMKTCIKIRQFINNCNTPSEEIQALSNFTSLMEKALSKMNQEPLLQEAPPILDKCFETLHPNLLPAQNPTKRERMKVVACIIFVLVFCMYGLNKLTAKTQI